MRLALISPEGLILERNKVEDQPIESGTPYPSIDELFLEAAKEAEKASTLKNH
jgi:hypothetical protein